MDCKKFAVATITLGRSEEEMARIKSGLQLLSDKKIPAIYVVDGGSSMQFLTEIRSIKNVQVITGSKKNLQPQVIESIQAAANSGLEFVFYTESDKARFFASGFDEFLSRATKIAKKDPNFGLIIPGRNKESFAMFPKFQQYTEGMLNNMIAVITDQQQISDYLYGPKIISKELIPYLDKIRDDVGWGWMSYLAIIVNRLGKKNYIVSLNLPTPVKNEIESEKERLLRLKQMKDHIDGIYLAKTLVYI